MARYVNYRYAAHLVNETDAEFGRVLSDPTATEADLDRASDANRDALNYHRSLYGLERLGPYGAASDTDDDRSWTQ